MIKGYIKYLQIAPPHNLFKAAAMLFPEVTQTRRASHRPFCFCPQFCLSGHISAVFQLHWLFQDRYIRLGIFPIYRSTRNLTDILKRCNTFFLSRLPDARGGKDNIRLQMWRRSFSGTNMSLVFAYLSFVGTEKGKWAICRRSSSRINVIFFYL